MMKTKLIVKTSMSKLDAVRKELRKKHDFKGEMNPGRYVVGAMRYIFAFLPIQVQWERLCGYHVDEVDMDDVLDKIHELEQIFLEQKELLAMKGGKNRNERTF